MRTVSFSCAKGLRNVASNFFDAVECLGSGALVIASEIARLITILVASCLNIASACRFVNCESIVFDSVQGHCIAIGELLDSTFRIALSQQ